MSAKDIQVRPISSQDAARIIKSLHYSGRVSPLAVLHFGVFLNGRCGGALQYGHSMKKREMMPLVSGTQWNGFLELNRAALAEWLPRNSESRALSVTLRMIKKHYPHIEWIVSFADATQCGDGTIYRASGFELVQIAKNRSLYRLPCGRVINNINMTGKYMLRELKNRSDVSSSWSYNKNAKILGAKPVEGYQLKYVYFLNKAARERLTVPIIPFSEIKKRGASMYRGKPPSVQSIDSDASGYQPEEGGAIPTCALQGAAHG